jgi:signal transduction histidine kinase
MDLALVASAGGAAIVDVKDDGPGTASEHQARVLTGSTGWTSHGLGRLVEANGGRIELISREDQGSTFRIRLPLVKTLETATVMA